MEDKYITVGQLNRYLKYKFDQDPNLNQVFLKGEISNFKAHTRGHLYFTIKDETSRINAVMFYSQASKISFTPEDGMKVLVTGRISVYEATGGYQIYVDDMIQDGVGNLYIEYEKLKRKLASEGLFDASKKKKIPKFPETIGIITAPTGAAIKDILSTIRRRWPITKTILFPSLVQGASAAPEIVKQIKKAQEYNLDVLIVGRGGGSIEDLWCFNDEEVARAIYECKIPVISAVGHEIDFTIADYVADLRAPTPTGAAEMAVANQTDFYNYMRQINLRLNKSMQNYIKNNRERLDTLKNSYILKNPISMYQIKEQKFDTLYEKLCLVMKNLIQNEKTSLQNKIDKIPILTKHLLERNQNQYVSLLNKLEILNPLLTIKRGYSITKKDDKVITSVKDLKKNDTLQIQLQDGSVLADVEKIINN
ncbi:MAG: exodeoxyribonuclease VII large subunit [Tenericutes bacterium]|nr:exodeoxyribonuclease VII large subunit [Mycoplasmatota bacterium]